MQPQARIWMKPVVVVLGTLAMIPAMIGPLKAEAGTIMAPLCNGGTAIVIVPASDPAPGSPLGPQQGPCCAKGYHCDNKRKRLDRTQ